MRESNDKVLNFKFTTLKKESQYSKVKKNHLTKNPKWQKIRRIFDFVAEKIILNENIIFK